MQTKSEIEDAVRTALPIVFGKSDSVVVQDFRARFHALTDSASIASEPFLRAETVRYQSILIYWSLILLTLHFFEVGTFKIGESVVKVDQKLFVILSVFLFAVAAVFLVKAYVDYQRTIFVRAKTVTAIDDLEYLITIGRAKRRIQDYFWNAIFNVIGRTYKTYADATATVLGEPTTFEHVEIPISLDLDKLSEVPELKVEIEAQTKSLASLKEALAADEERFKNRISTVTLDRSTDDDPLYAPSRHKQFIFVQTAFDQYLGHWFAARNALTSEQLKAAYEMADFERMTAMRSILERTSTIRKVYVLFEVAAPVAFAVLSSAYVWITSK